MRRIWVLCVVLAGVFFLSGLLRAADGGDRWIVRLKAPSGAARDAVSVAVERSGGRVLHAFDLIPAVAIELPGPALAGILNNPTLQEVVQGVEPDAVVKASESPTASGQGKGKPPPPPDPAQTLEWGVNRIDADLAWATSRGTGVKVCVIDTGIDKDHPDLVANLKGGVNFVWQKGRLNPSNWDDDDGHGTHVAGIIAAADNTIGVVGVAPEAWLYAAKVLNKQGSGYVSDVIAGINWAVNNGMQVANMSLGTSADIQSLHDACDTAYARGIVLVGAAGNSGDGDATTNEVEYPGAYSSVIAVAAADSADQVAAWSSSGPQVELAAPGVSIRSTYMGGGYKILSGTSMAAPHVSGTAGLVIKAVPGITAVGVRQRLDSTADDILAPGPDNLSGNGLVDAEEATTGHQTSP
jgi:subtilisin family serine protease